MFDWHEPLCNLLKISEDSSIDDISEALEDAAAKLDLADNLGKLMYAFTFRQPLTNTTHPEYLPNFSNLWDHSSLTWNRPTNTALQVELPPRWQVINRIQCQDAHEDEDDMLYLGDPYIVERGPQNAHVVGSKAITNGLELYLEKNKDVSFIVYRDYQCCSMTNLPLRRSDKASPPVPSDFLSGETISIVSKDLSEALQAVAKVALDDLPTATFEVHEEFWAPFPWWYHRRKEIAEAQRELDKRLQEQLSTLEGYVVESLESEWSKVDSLLAEGMISAEYLHYLFVS